MIRNCIYCNIPIDLKKHGLTKYCSSLCRNKDYYIKKQTGIKNENKSENESREKLSDISDSSLNKQNDIENNSTCDSASKRQKNNINNNSIFEEMMLPESYKAIIEEKGKNYELLAKINLLELKNEALQKNNQDLENEINHLQMEIDELENTDNNKGQIFGVPSSMFQSVLVEILTPHASNIISGFMKKKEPTSS
jgi:hypothetical protein